MLCCFFNFKSVLFQHKDFEEIEGRLKRREPVLLGSTAAQRLSRRLPIEVVSDPLNDVDNDPYDNGSDVQKQLRGHQVHILSKDCSVEDATVVLFTYYCSVGMLRV